MSAVRATKRKLDVTFTNDVDTSALGAVVPRIEAATVLTASSVASVEKGVETMRALFQLPPSIVEGMPKNDETDVVFALDTSPSMEEAMPLLREVVKKLPVMLTGGSVIKKVNCAIGVFDHVASMFAQGEPTGYVPFGELTSVAALNIASRLSTEGGSGTNTEAMILLGCAELRRIREERHRPAGYVQHLVLVTDGHPTYGEKNSARLGRIVKHQVDIDTLGHAVVVHVLCLGNDIDRHVPKELVRWTGGIVGHAKTAEELAAEMGRITTPILSSSTAFTLAIRDDGVKDDKDVRYRRYGLLTSERCETLFSLFVAPKFSAGTHIAATVGLANAEMAESSIMLKFVPDAEYQALPTAVPPPALLAKLEEERLERKEQDEIRAALACNDFNRASEISQTYTQLYQDRGLTGAAARASCRTARLDEMSTDAHELPSLGHDGASMTMDALASQSVY